MVNDNNMITRSPIYIVRINNDGLAYLVIKGPKE